MTVNLIKNYKALFNNSNKSVTNLSNRDDGVHSLPGDKFFEWWYFDAHFSNGYYLVIALHSHLFNITSRPSVIAVHLYGPDNFIITEVLPFKSADVSLSKLKCDLLFGSTKVSDQGNYYKIELKAKRIQTSLEFHRDLDGVRIGTGILFDDEENNESFRWNVPLPRAIVSGWMIIDDEKLDVDGIGYHDHNWGNIDLQYAFKRWVWGRILTKDFSIIFADIIGRKCLNNRVKLYAMWQGNDLIICTDKIETNIFEDLTISELRFPENFHIEVNELNSKVSADFKTERYLDNIDFAQPRINLKRFRKLAEIIYILSGMVPGGKLVKKVINNGLYIRLNTKCDLHVLKNGDGYDVNDYALCEIIDFGADL